jgi:cation transport ATPase
MLFVNEWGVQVIPNALRVSDLISWVLTTPVLYGVGWQFHRKAFRSIRNRSLGMDFLVSMGAFMQSVVAWVVC